jgi:hypothetical protein
VFQTPLTQTAVTRTPTPSLQPETRLPFRPSTSQLRHRRPSVSPRHRASRRRMVSSLFFSYQLFTSISACRKSCQCQAGRGAGGPQEGEREVEEEECASQLYVLSLCVVRRPNVLNPPAELRERDSNRAPPESEEEDDINLSAYSSSVSHYSLRCESSLNNMRRVHIQGHCQHCAPQDCTEEAAQRQARRYANCYPNAPWCATVTCVLPFIL